MANETTQMQDDERQSSQVAGALSGSAVAVDPSGSAGSAQSMATPPRIDSGDDVDDVLTEVSKLFGGTMPASAPLPLMAGHLDDMDELASVRPQIVSSAAPAEPSADLAPGTAADLFRTPTPDAASPAGPVVEEPAAEEPAAEDSVDGVPDNEAPLKELPAAEEPLAEAAAADEPESDSAAEPSEAPRAGDAAAMRDTPRLADAARFGSKAGAAPAPRAGRLPARSKLRLPPIQVPKNAILPAAIAATALMGVIIGGAFTRWTTPAGVSAQSTETDSAESDALTEELQAKIAAAEAELRQARQERDAAARERDQVAAQLKQLAARPVAAATASAVGRDDPARRQIEAKYQRAEEELQMRQRRLYNVQLARVRDVWRSNPGLAVALLEDGVRCPPEVRDFTWGYLYSRSKNDRASVMSHRGPVTGVGWSPDGTLVATCGQDGLVKLWDAAGGKEIASLLAHAGGVASIAFSQRGDLLASAGADGTIKLWNVASRKISATFYGHIGGVRAVACAPDGSALVSAGDDGTIKFWDATTRRALATRWPSPRAAASESAVDPEELVRSLAYSPDGRLVAAGARRAVRIWEVDGAVEKSTLALDDGPVTALAFSPDGTTLAASFEGALLAWDVRSMRPRSEPMELAGPVHGMTFSPDGRLLALAVRDGALIVRQASGQALGSSGRTARLRGHVDGALGVAFSPDGQTLATCGRDGSIKFWNPQSGEVDKTVPDLVLRDHPRAASLAYSRDGRLLAAASADVITIWNVRDGVETATLRGRAAEMTRIAFSPDGSLLASASRDWPILVWNLGSQRVKTALNGHAGSVNSLGYSRDGSLVISASDDATVRLWDAATGHERTAFAGHRGAVLAAELSPDGGIAASGGADRSVKLWDVATRREIASLAGHSGAVVGLAFAPDGRFLVSIEGVDRASSHERPAAGRQPIRVWNVARHELVRELGEPGAALCDVAFTPDGRTLGTSGTDGLSLWDAQTGEPRETLQFPTAGPIGPLAFSPDGRSLAGGGDAALIIWSSAPYAATAGAPAADSRPPESRPPESRPADSRPVVDGKANARPAE